MKIEGKHKCQNCKKEFDWFYQVPQRYGTTLEVEEISKDKALVYNIIKSIDKNGFKLPLIVTVYCPKCNYLNIIEVENKE